MYPNVSVIIPAYNADRFIRDTLTTVAAQTYAAIEILVVDDGSTDNTAKIVSAFTAQDPRIRLIQTRNGGVARARNIGLQEARGRYVAFLDADDLWHPEKIARQVAFMDEHAEDPRWAAVYTLHHVIDEHGVVLDQGREWSCSGYMYARHLCMRFVGNGSTIMTLRTAAQAVGGFDPRYADAGVGGCEDLDFEFKIAAQYRIGAINQFLVGYRRYAGNMSSDPVRMAQALCVVTEQCFQRGPSLPRSVQRWARASADRYGFLTLIGHMRLRLAAWYYFQMLKHDPSLAIISAATVALGVWKRLAVKTGLRTRPTRAVPFENAPVASAANIKRKLGDSLHLPQLERTDRELESDRCNHAERNAIFTYSSSI